MIMNDPYIHRVDYEQRIANAERRAHHLQNVRRPKRNNLLRALLNRNR